MSKRTLSEAGTYLIPLLPENRRTRFFSKDSGNLLVLILLATLFIPVILFQELIVHRTQDVFSNLEQEENLRTGN
jgi:hypothetical protein